MHLGAAQAFARSTGPLEAARPSRELVSGQQGFTATACRAQLANTAQQRPRPVSKACELAAADVAPLGCTKKIDCPSLALFPLLFLPLPLSLALPPYHCNRLLKLLQMTRASPMDFPGGGQGATRSATGRRRMKTRTPSAAVQRAATVRTAAVQRLTEASTWRCSRSTAKCNPAHLLTIARQLLTRLNHSFQVVIHLHDPLHAQSSAQCCGCGATGLSLPTSFNPMVVLLSILMPLSWLAANVLPLGLGTGGVFLACLGAAGFVVLLLGIDVGSGVGQVGGS